MQNQEINRIIHAPARLVIMKMLYILDAADMVFLKRETQLTWGNLSVQIKKLEEAGYISIKKDFVENKPHTLIRLTDVGREAFDGYRKNLIDFLE